MTVRGHSDPLAPFHPAVRDWFTASFAAPTRAQALGWPAIARGESSVILAPTGSGKTLAAFLWCLDRLMFAALPEQSRRCRVLYVSPLKALVPTKRGAHLAVSIERLAVRCLAAPQRIGLSATGRPLDEVARFLGGVD